MLALEDSNLGLIKSINDISLYDVNINNDFTNMFEVMYLNYHTIDEVNYLSIGPGVIMDIGYEM
jgi:hypothetical protein